MMSAIFESVEDGRFESLDGTVEQKYSLAVEYLNESAAYMLSHVLNLGYPVLDEHAQTAYVALETVKGKQTVVFHLNPQFVQTLTPAQLATVLAHETMHYKLDHPALGASYSDPQRFNIAADLVINDYLVSYLGLVTVPGILHGLDVVGTDCSWLTVSQVYEMLQSTPQAPSCGLQDLTDQQGPAGEGEESQDDDVSDTKPGAQRAKQAKALKDFLDELPESGSAVWDMPESLTDQNYGSGGCSTAPSLSEERHVEVDSSLSLNWIKLLEEVDPKMFSNGKGKGKVNATFARRPRRLASAPTNVALPDYTPADRGRKDKGSTPVIVLALDTSGSIRDSTVKKFLTLAQSIPQAKAIVEVCTFTTSYRRLNLDKPSYQSGGTSFSAVHKFVEEVMQSHRPKVKYPDRVIVITDGMAYFDRSGPTDEELKSWRWLLEGNYRHDLQHYVKADMSTVFSLDSFVK